LRTIEAVSGADALAQAREAQPAVILMDIRLPDMDGGDVVRQLKADARTQRIPVIALTSLALGEVAFLEAGFNGYLEKPIDVREFPDEVWRFSGS
jgi:two-component system, cell cycle response regulator DivK